jgi:hypothetical protein
MVLEGIGCAMDVGPPPSQKRGSDDFARVPLSANDFVRVPLSEVDPKTVRASAPEPRSAHAPASNSDAGLDEPRFCEEGWPTTKASYCQTVDMGTEFERVECCGGYGSRECCVRQEGQ